MFGCVRDVDRQNVEQIVSVPQWLLLLHMFRTAMEMLLILTCNLENISNKKKKYLLALVCLPLVNGNNNWLRIISHVSINLQLSLIVNDQDKISPNHINTISSRQVMRIKTHFNYGTISSSNTKFSKLTSQESYKRQ